jgi:hypothetical protein
LDNLASAGAGDGAMHKNGNGPGHRNAGCFDGCNYRNIDEPIDQIGLSLHNPPQATMP